MNKVPFQRIFGLLLMLTGVSQLPSIGVAWWHWDSSLGPLAMSAAIEVMLGGVLWWPARKRPADLRVRDGFLVVSMAWITVALGSALPLLLMKHPDLSVVDSIFEAVSGLTTTGATVLSGLDDMPRGLLYHRAQLQWLGGMGIIVLAVAILPMLRIGGMQLYRAETPGPMKDAKLTPRITETAKALWLIYLSITVLCVIAYAIAGMGIFDAVTHAFTTVPIGGFSNYDGSIGHFDNPLIESVAMVFMVIAGINFALHFTAWREANSGAYFADPELRTFLVLLAVFIMITSLGVYQAGIATDLREAFRLGAFQAISAMTTTGYTNDSFYLWPGFLPMMLILICFIGACAGSTGGGMKVIRVMLLYKQVIREIRRLVHPRAVLAIKLGERPVSDSVIGAIWAFFFLYMASYVTIAMLVHASGVDLITGFSATAASLTNLGPALGEAGPNFSSLNDFAKCLLAFAMLLGRLEVFTLFVLLTPGFWKE